MSKSIALIGNPNCGKTTLFNRLTGANQRVGNWPGVTVEQHHGEYVDPFTRNAVHIIDLPGCYSLINTPDMALDEKITCEYVAVSKNIIYLNVLDAAHLNRDLYLTLQLLELGVPVVVVLNCMDLAQSAGISINAAALATELGCPVVPVIAKTSMGIAELQSALRGEIEPNKFALQHPAKILPTEITEDVQVAQFRRNVIKQILQDTTSKQKVKRKFTDFIDNIVLHKIFGPAVFLGVMYLMFTLAINIGGYAQEWCERFSEQVFVGGLQSVLSAIGAAPWLSNLLSEGLGRGISITLTFTPVLASMFICLGILETTGYMTRAAFIVDRLMRYLGLSGKAFVPMIVGFGCNVPAVMGARTLNSQRERILMIMMTPFMSCSARLAIYAIFVAAFFPVGGQNVIFSLYLIGIAVAMLTALALRNSVVQQEESMALMEMPDYRWPMLSGLLRQAWTRLKSFLFKAGILIVGLCVLINGVGNDILANIGQFLTPMFAPIGISAQNWPATVGLVTGLIAKEAVVGTLNAFYASDAAMVQSFGGTIPAYAYLLFTLLYFPCVSVVAVISKELNFKWALFSVVWSTGLAYLIAALFYQVATFNSWAWILGLSTVLLGFFIAARWVVRKEQARVARRKLVPTLVTVD